jgi:hypothetical protein
MAADFVISNAVDLAMLNALTTAVDAGTAAVINIYSGTVPADVDTALGAQVLLAQLTMSGTSFPTATDLNRAAASPPTRSHRIRQRMRPARRRSSGC